MTHENTSRRPITERMRKETGYLLAKAGVRLVECINEKLEPLNLVERQFAALYMAKEGDLNQQQIAEALFVSRNTMVQILDGLETDHLITRVRNPENRRENFIHLTKKGHHLCEKATEIVRREVEEDVFGKIPNEKETLNRLLLAILE